MKPSNILFLIMFLFIFACSGAPRQTSTPSITLANKSPSLPPTWTHTVTSIPSQTAVHTPTLTFTPLPSTTPLPVTLTRKPTSDAPIPSATPTITPTLDTSCSILTQEEGVPILSAPFIDPYRVLPTMSPDSIFEATSVYTPYIQLELNGVTVGWVDSGLQTLELQDPGCDQLPIDERELNDFPSLCFFSSDDELITYADRALTEPYQTITSTLQSVLLLKYSDVYYSSMGESGPGFFVRISDVTTLGECESVPFAGLTIKDTWLWSQPDGELGQQLEKIRPAQRIFIQPGPVEGVKPPSTNTDGAWYLVIVGSQSEGRYGWIWSSHIFIE